jgi:hypothetical protein
MRNQLPDFGAHRMTQVFWVNQPQEQGAQLDVVHGDALGG